MMQVGSREWRNLIAQGAESLGIRVGACQMERFSVHSEQLLAWTKKCNLTAITDPEEIETRHFLDSLSVLYALPSRQPSGSALRMIDVGSGAGFPGIPVSMVLSDVHVTLLEATGKKAEFLSHMVDTLGLRGVEVIKGRAEDLGRSVGRRERYDVAVARAVAALSTLAEYCLPFISPGGVFVALKKGDIREEIEHSATAFRVLGGGEVRLLSVPLPQLPDSRYLVCSTKKSHTPPHYPRRAGMPAKHPL